MMKFGLRSFNTTPSSLRRQGIRIAQHQPKSRANISIEDAVVSAIVVAAAVVTVVVAVDSLPVADEVALATVAAAVVAVVDLATAVDEVAAVVRPVDAVRLAVEVVEEPVVERT
jgi:hypothetical protein